MSVSRVGEFNSVTQRDTKTQRGAGLWGKNRSGGRTAVCSLVLLCFFFFLHETQTQSASGNVVPKHSCGHFTSRRRVLGFSNRASEDLAGSCGQGRLILLIASRGGRTWAACRNQENEEKLSWCHNETHTHTHTVTPWKWLWPPAAYFSVAYRASFVSSSAGLIKHTHVVQSYMTDFQNKIMKWCFVLVISL